MSQQVYDESTSLGAVSVQLLRYVFFFGFCRHTLLTTIFRCHVSMTTTTRRRLDKSTGTRRVNGYTTSQRVHEESIAPRLQMRGAFFFLLSYIE